MVRIIISNMGIWPYGRSRVHEMRFDPSGSILHGLLNYGTGWRGTTGPPSSPWTYARLRPFGPARTSANPRADLGTWTMGTPGVH